MKERIEIPIGENKLVAIINDWKDEMPKEIFISLFDKNGRCFQDICMVREHYHYSTKDEDFKIDSSLVDCMVWADSDNEDYTHKFTIGVYEEEE